jgi:hypothetical protein
MVAWLVWFNNSKLQITDYKSQCKNATDFQKISIGIGGDFIGNSIFARDKFS